MVSAADLAKLSPEAAAQANGDVHDRHLVAQERPPARRSSTSRSKTEEMGTIGVTSTIKYDGTVDVSAPPADQVTDMPLPSITAPSRPSPPGRARSACSGLVEFRRSG